MFWTGLIIGIFIGANVSLLLYAMYYSRKGK